MKGINMIGAFRAWFNPTPRDHAAPGFKPNLYFKALRYIARGLIVLLRLTGKNRFSNEFIQLLSPTYTVVLPSQKKLTFRTGHGRLLWRAQTLLTEEPMMISWLNRMTPQDTFFDIGANVGCYSLYAASQNVSTYAFEADLNNVSVLYENIFLNKLSDSCMPVPLAVGNQTNCQTMYLRGIERSGDALHSVGRPNYLVEQQHLQPFTIKTLVVTLDDMVKLFRLPLPTHIKIDVDGNELLILEGARTLLSHVSELYIEIDKALDEHQRIFDILRSYSLHVVEKDMRVLKWGGDVGNYIFKRQ
jgi:FkbM family methyltransferase